MPTEETIRSKIVEVLLNTITLAKFRYEQELGESLYKTASLIGLDDYKNMAKAISEATKIRAKYEELKTFDELVEVGMGKEALGPLF